MRQNASGMPEADRSRPSVASDDGIALCDESSAPAVSDGRHFIRRWRSALRRSPRRGDAHSFSISNRPRDSPPTGLSGIHGETRLAPTGGRGTASRRSSDSQLDQQSQDLLLLLAQSAGFAKRTPAKTGLRVEHVLQACGFGRQQRIEAVFVRTGTAIRESDHGGMTEQGGRKRGRSARCDAACRDQSIRWLSTRTFDVSGSRRDASGPAPSPGGWWPSPSLHARRS